MDHVRVISKEVIRPSLPTTHRSMQLSLLDQIAPEIYTHLILFYSTGAIDLLEVRQKLKASLSNVLNQFYPLAGRIIASNNGHRYGALHVDCNDEGVVFIEARSDTDLSVFLLQPPINEFKELLPVKTSMYRQGEPLLALQFTKFINGFALGMSISHLIADGASMTLFLNRWGETARELKQDRPKPCFTSASTLFPPKPLMIAYQEPQEPFENPGVAIKRFIISSSSMEKLRGSAYKRDQMPTRVEAASALILRCALRTAAGERAATAVSHVVNLRNRFTGLSDVSNGNLWTGAVAEVRREDGQEVVEKLLRSAAMRVDEEYVRNEIERFWRRKNGLERHDEKPISNERLWIISSWCRIPLYKSDFGWGEPVWIGCGIKDMKDVCILIDAKDGVGVEAWLWMEREEMDRLEKDEEFRFFVSP